AVLVLCDLFMPKTLDRKILGWVGIAAVFAAMAATAAMVGGPVQSILHDTFRIDSFSLAFKLLLLCGGVLVLFLAVSYEPK
ncbi:NADH-quinone oxidoreductase subunit N, partial [Alkalihalophilus pseudofirmus]|nr:NADH-quinone oxidoreductase subunit N [Alkalihalophilus pseudofirmus]